MLQGKQQEQRFARTPEDTQYIGCKMKRIKEEDKRRGQKKRIKKETAAKQSLVEVGGDGFEPPKLEAADLQSAPFGHSGNHPCF